MNDAKSTSFVFNDKLYLIDGQNYYVYDGTYVTDVSASAYIPTAYINIPAAGEYDPSELQYEQRNILTPKFKVKFIGDGETVTYDLPYNSITSIDKIVINGTELASTGYSVDTTNGTITFATAPDAPQTEYEDQGNVEITISKAVSSVNGMISSASSGADIIKKCSIATTFDGRVFMSGNTDCPNNVFWCGRANGVIDPTYFGELDYQQDGVGTSPVKGMIPVSNTLLVLKGDTQQDGTVFYHTPQTLANDITTVIYPSVQGLFGIGCQGACTNFLDDPVFISRLGVEAVGQLSTRNERAIEHRSSLVDAKLTNLDLSKAVIKEWNGYLVVLIEGKIFLADSRQRFTDETGVMQYEWYYLEDIGSWDLQYQKYEYSKYEELNAGLQAAIGSEITLPSSYHYARAEVKTANNVFFYDTIEYKNLEGETANNPLADGTPSATIETGTASELDINYIVHEKINPVSGEFEGYEAFLCKPTEEKIGGNFVPATSINVYEDKLLFGTSTGEIFSFNTDMREAETGTIPAKFYTFNGRTIRCGCATKMDNCGIPHLTKNTVRKSTVIKTKSMEMSSAKIKVRTNEKAYEQTGRIDSSVFSFDNVLFDDFSFETKEQSLFLIREKEKHWVEKQYFIYSDEFMKPFSLFYVVYRYFVLGRFKE